MSARHPGESVQRIGLTGLGGFPESGTIALFDTAKEVASVLAFTPPPRPIVLRPLSIALVFPARNDNGEARSERSDGWLTRLLSRIAGWFRRTPRLM